MDRRRRDDRRDDDRVEERRRPDRDEEPEPRRRPPREANRMARLAAGYVAAMTGKHAEGITSLQRSDDGWTIGVEVVETRRIPDSTDVLAVYEAELDADGELLAYRRVKRYTRCQLGEK
jgi:gas vesicle protein GvpO